ncbi:hypothetical protein [Sporolactobacillus inulinus]|jgi:hypothetical protein|nr:hypothetical protein [Sporolactobacillus inulinus]
MIVFEKVCTKLRESLCFFMHGEEVPFHIDGLLLETALFDTDRRERSMTTKPTGVTNKR